MYQVYRNLHNQLFSIKEKKSGLVVAHASYVYMGTTRFVVRKAGQSRARTTGVRNVHAWVEGDILDFDGSVYRGRFRDLNRIVIDKVECLSDFTYNPFRFDSFVDAKTLMPVYAASFVELRADNTVCRYRE